jgi:hypothetical protein
MLEVALYVLDKVLAVLPPWIVRRFLPPERIAEQIEIDLRRINPIVIYFTSVQFPYVELWFRISNQSQLNLVLDRLLIDLWVGQPTVRGAVLHRVELQRRTSKDDISFWHDLTGIQEDRIRKQVDAKGVLTVPVSIYVDAYFESRVGFVHVRVPLEHRGVAVT